MKKTRTWDRASTSYQQYGQRTPSRLTRLVLWLGIAGVAAVSLLIICVACYVVVRVVLP